MYCSAPFICAILNVLAESKLGSMPSTQLRAEVMKEMGCSDRTYERAYADMIRKGELHKRQIMQKNGERGWFTFLAYGGKINGEVPVFGEVVSSPAWLSSLRWRSVIFDCITMKTSHFVR